MDPETDAKFPGGSFIRISIILLYKATQQSVQHIRNMQKLRSECRQIYTNQQFCQLFVSPGFLQVWAHRWLRLNGRKQLSKHRAPFHFFIS